MNIRELSSHLFRAAQLKICSDLEELDSVGRFREDAWKRPEKRQVPELSPATHRTGQPDGQSASDGGYDGGGGYSRVLAGGSVFEQAGVNFSEVHGTLPSEMSLKLVGRDEPTAFFATGISIVIHPFSPMIPTTHANYRYLEVGDRTWFGGGGDLTPYYLFNEDAQHFHRTFKVVCDKHSPELYAQMKSACDEYFYLPHRQEARGIGGIFFDYLGREDPPAADYIPLVTGLLNCFQESYLPIVKRRMNESWGEQEKAFQLLRRGRYVEFNLLYDRGTLFGLKTSGRTESILMSLPPLVRWEYNFQPTVGSREAELLETLREPRNWV